MADIFRFFNAATNSHYFAAGAAERAAVAAAHPTWVNEGRAFGADTVPSPGSVSVIRFYNPTTDRYLFTSNLVEQAIIKTQGWIEQVAVFQVFPTEVSGTTVGATTGVIRIYVSALDSHVYSSNPVEIAILSAGAGNIVEGPAFFISPTGTTLDVNSEPTGLPLITGTPDEGQTLTADTQDIKDADGLGTFTYQWTRDGVDISGATVSTYKLTSADFGGVIAVRVNYTDGGGTAEGPLTSLPTTAINNVNDAPTGIPVIQGTTVEDETLTANTSDIKDKDGLGAFSYQWTRDGVDIPGASGSTHKLSDADVGAAIAVKVTYTDGNGTTEGPLTSTPTIAIINVNDAPTGTPVITGTPTEGQTLTANTDGIKDADGLGAFSYQWVRDGANIGGANASTYELTSADVGAAITVKVGYTDGNGTTEGPLTSAAAPTIDPSGLTINLTANADVPGAVSPAANTQGAQGDDTYNGVIDTTGNATTFSNADVLAGAGGTADTHNLRIASTTNGFTVNAVSTGVEVFNTTNQDTSGNKFILNLQNTTDETKVASVSSAAGSNTSAINVDSGTVDSPTTAAMTNTFGTFEVNFKGTRTGKEDAFSLELNGAGSTTDVATFGTITSTGNNDNSFEIANITSSTKESFVSLGSAGMTLSTVNVSGDAKLTLMENQNFAGLKTVDANKMTGGGLFIDARDSTESDFSFTGSDSDDRIILKNDTISGTSGSLNGAGSKDTLASQNFNGGNGNAAFIAGVNKATNFEVLEGIGGAESLSDVSAYTKINEFLFSGTTANGSKTYSGLESDDSIAFSTDIKGQNDAIRLNGKNAGTNAHIELRAVDTTNGQTEITASTNNNDREALLIQTNISTLEISSTGTNTNANLIESQGTNNNFFDYGIGNQTTAIVTIVGSHDLTIQAKAGISLSGNNEKIAGFSNAVNLDASAFTGILRVAGSTKADTIKGGTNDDIIYGLNGDDTLTGGGGKDQFRVSAAESQNGTDTIKDFVQGTDMIGIFDGKAGNTTATPQGATLNTSDYVTSRSQINDISGGDNNKVIEMQSAISQSDLNAATGSAVSAFVLLFNSDTNKGELWYDSDWSSTGGRVQVVTFDNVVDITGITNFSNADFVEYTH